MMNGFQDAPLGLLSFLSFAFSVIAAVLAIDMYKLLRTGGFGKTWRLLITTSVMLVLLQVLRMAEILNFRPLAEAHLAEIVELCFIMSLAYAFYVQSRVFNHNQKPPLEDDETDSSDDEENEQVFFDDYNEDYNKDDSSATEAEDNSVATTSKKWAQYGSTDISRPAP